jgi:hypothetical protein
MSWLPGTFIPIIIAVSAAKKRLHEEEVEMARYTTEELNDDWEFKIVRSAFYAFGNPEKLRRLMEEEARAGWVMVEKLDDARVRFKRPRSARERDQMLEPGVDPYRTEYSTLGGRSMNMALVAGGLALLLGLGLLLFMIMVVAR